jgi:hypothetical protein
MQLGEILYWGANLAPHNLIFNPSHICYNSGRYYFENSSINRIYT